MGLDSYIFKTTRQNADKKIDEILAVKQKGMEKAFHIDGIDGFDFLIDEDMNYMDELNPDVYWRKYNHITAWFSEKVFGNPKGIIKTSIGVVPKSTLIKLRNACMDVLEYCKTTIDKEYCRKIFPYVDMAFSGDSDYNEGFIEELRKAKNDIDLLLFTSNNPNAVFIFYADI